MKIIEKKLSDIKPYERNPRRNDEAVKYLMESIKQFGFKQPIVVDSDGVIVAGHTRFKAAKNLGMKEVPCVVADDLTPEQVKAFRLADNKVGEIATWDFELLGLELDELAEFEIDMDDFGFYNDFDEDRFDDLFQNKPEEESEKAPKEEAPPQWKVIIHADGEDEAREIKEQLVELGYACEVSA